MTSKPTISSLLESDKERAIVPGNPASEKKWHTRATSGDTSTEDSFGLLLLKDLAIRWKIKIFFPIQDLVDETNEAMKNAEGCSSMAFNNGSRDPDRFSISSP